MNARPAVRPLLHATEPTYIRARQLADDGCTQEEIAGTLRRAFPGLPNDNYYHNPAAIAVMERIRRRQREATAREQGRARTWQPRDTPGSPAPAAVMSAGLVAFAEAMGLRCAYCGRAGSPRADPDGLAWCRDSVPRGFQVGGRDMELACSACKARPDRHGQLGGDTRGSL